MIYKYRLPIYSDNSILKYLADKSIMQLVVFA